MDEQEEPSQQTQDRLRLSEDDESPPEDVQKAGARRDFISLLTLGFGFTLLFTAFQTGSQVSELVFKSYDKEHDTSINAYNGAVVLYIVFAMANWIAPSIISIVKPKLSLIGGAACYTIYLSMFLYPSNAVLYIYSVIIGIGAAVLWTAQGTLMVAYSNKETMDRNANIFWAQFQTCLIIGPLYVFFTWHGKDEIADSDRITLYSILTGLAGASMVIFALLRQPSSGAVVSSGDRSLKHAVDAFKNSIKLAFTKQMGLLMLPMAYSGFILSMYSLVLPTSVGSTAALPDAKSLVGLVGLLVGVGEIVGATSYGFLTKWFPKWARGFIILFAMTCHLTSFVLIFIALPADAPFGNLTDEPTYVQPTAFIIGTISVLLGLGDSAFNTQIMGILGHLYKDDSAPAFALYKFAQSFTAGVGFFYSSILILRWQLLIQAMCCLFGASGYLLVEYKMERPGSSYEQI